ncbi:hypothetical protein [uncultured Nocardioides sp.]|uniref:hypothetical protein n=1 Tax=uncultured Nocardioides sp. TaxID=198441 RepID=UPI002624D658|nr:hypothetical protein [uncultured Nocardioides sp.]
MTSAIAEGLDQRRASPAAGTSPLRRQQAREDQQQTQHADGGGDGQHAGRRLEAVQAADASAQPGLTGGPALGDGEVSDGDDGDADERERHDDADGHRAVG